MVDTGKKKVFISYSTKDVTLANVVRNELTAMSLNVWFDSYVIQPGQHISTQIAEGMNATDYVVVLISENSNQSDWVKREISLAFDLSQKKGLSIIPFLIDKAEVPLEFRGLLYIDGTKSIKVGLERLTDFFKAQASKAVDAVPRWLT
jgi:hypothetical protein